MLSTFLDAVSAVMAEQKRETIDAMDLRAGDAGLDVGCGTGDEVRLIAERVGPSGQAVGVDVNDGLLATARERTPGDLPEVLFLLADAQALPFADGEFAAARVERALQHMADPGGAIAEMARVVRPGGRVVALESDWETLVVSSRDDQRVGPSLVAVAAEQQVPREEHGWTGRAIRLSSPPRRRCAYRRDGRGDEPGFQHEKRSWEAEALGARQAHGLAGRNYVAGATTLPRAFWATAGGFPLAAHCSSSRVRSC